jgi:uncharacterized membrane protein
MANSKAARLIIMGATTHSIDVSASLTAVYNQWTQFEEFPRFMEGVIEIQQLTPKTLLWKVNIGGKEKQWEAEIVEQIPDTRIVWESIDGAQNRGVISFESLDLEQTRITLTMEYEPEGLLEMAGDVLGIPSNQVEGDLNRFRDFIERNATETGSWRGQIDKGESLESNGGISQEVVLGVENGDRSTGIQDGEIPPSSMVTRKMAPDTVEKGPERLPAEESRSLSIAGPATELSPRAEPISGPRPGVKAGSQFYRDEGVLAPTHEQIAQRAYQLYLARRKADGYDLDDWLKAEKQLSEDFFDDGLKNRA